MPSDHQEVVFLRPWAFLTRSGNIPPGVALETPRTYNLLQFEEETDSSVIGIIIHAAAAQ
jgi:hypothetical protein